MVVTHMGEVMMVTRDRKGAPQPQPSCVFNVSDPHLDRPPDVPLVIKDLAFTSDGKTLLIFTSWTRCIHALEWRQDEVARQGGLIRNWRWSRRDVTFQEDSNNCALFGCTPSNKANMFAASNGVLIIVFERLGPGGAWVSTSDYQTLVPISIMRFSSEGDDLAALDIEGTVHLFRLPGPHGVTRIELERTYSATHGLYTKLAWTKKTELLMCSDTMQSLVSSDTTLFQNDAIPLLQNSEGLLGVHPFNHVQYILCSPTTETMIATTGYNGLIHFFAKKYKARIRRDLLHERFLTREILPEDKLGFYMHENNQSIAKLSSLLEGVAQQQKEKELRDDELSADLERVLRDNYAGRGEADAPLKLCESLP